MLNPNAKLSAKAFADDIEKKPTRDGFGTGTIEAGRADRNVVVLCADLKESTRAEWFQKEFPDRFVEMGIGEQNMAATAAGFALAGKIPFIASYAAFSPGRNYEQIRTTVALNDVPVNVCGMHAGVSVGPDGATHQMLEDIAMMRAMPNMIVLNPCDAEEARKATVAAATHGKPTYLRFGRSAVPLFTTPETPFQIGKAQLLWNSEKPKVAFLSTGALTYEALLAARALHADGVESIVAHFGTIKPLDEAAVVAAAKAAKIVITVEEHQVAGGFGSAVAELLSDKHPTRVHRIGIDDRYGESGDPDELLDMFGLTAPHLADAAKKLLA